MVNRIKEYESRTDFATGYRFKMKEENSFVQPRDFVPFYGLWKNLTENNIFEAKDATEVLKTAGLVAYNFVFSGALVLGAIKGLEALVN